MKIGLVMKSLALWPAHDESLCVNDTSTMGIQVNGKMRGTLEVTAETVEDEAVLKAKKIISAANALIGKKIVKVIYKPGKI